MLLAEVIFQLLEHNLEEEKKKKKRRE